MFSNSAETSLPSSLLSPSYVPPALHPDNPADERGLRGGGGVTHTFRVCLRVYAGGALAVDGADGNRAALKRWCTPRMSTTSGGRVSMEGKRAAGRGYLGGSCGVLRTCRVALSSGGGMVGIHLNENI